MKIEYLSIHDDKADQYLSKDKYFNSNFKRIKSIINGEIAIDKDTGELAGAIYVGGGSKSSNKNYGFIQTLEVYDKYKRCGIGTKLLMDAIKKYHAVDLTVYKSNKIALEMYKKHGFVIIGYGNDGEKDYWMKLKSGLTKEDREKMESFHTMENFIRFCDKMLITNESKTYERPYSYEQIKKNYGLDLANKLMKDPAHKFRAETGIELIHKEPSLDELKRIYDNWNLMPEDLKKKSDEKSIDLFGISNKDHYQKLLIEYKK